jgi:phosphotransferase system enzyme I (PtsI)
MKTAIEAFDKAGKPISICGELGCDIPAIPVLLGIGLRKLSMSGASVAAVKSALASLTIEKCEEIAGKVLKMSTAQEVKSYLSSLV